MDARDLSFKAKRIDGQGWAYGDYIHEPDALGCIYDSLPGWTYECHAVHPNTLGMYTGSQDSKGHRIYDGDILILTGSYEDTDGSMQPFEEIHKIVYMRGCFYAHNIKGFPDWPLLCEVVDGLHEGETYEIIGNIHDEGVEDEI